MRKSSFFASLLSLAVLAGGCWPYGRDEVPAARMHPRVRVGIDIPDPEVVLGRAVRDDGEFGPEWPAIAEVYRIRTGDSLEIGVWGEEMTKKVTVGPDGRISYFKATEVLAAGHTLNELKNMLAARLKADFREEFIKDQVFISLTESKGYFVTVTGIVKGPGKYRINNDSRLLDVIADAGGIPLGTSRLGENFTEVADLSQAFVLRGDKFLNVDFEKLLPKKKGRHSARGVAVNNVLLQPGDRIYIPSAISLDNKIFVVGAVRRPSLIRYSKEITFLEALLRAGDVPNAAWERKSFIVRGRMNRPEIIPVNTRDLRIGKIADIQLQAGDVIFMPKTPLAKIAEVVSQMDIIFTGVTSAESAYKVRFDRN